MGEQTEQDRDGDRLIGAVYDAALAPETWTDVLRAIERTVGGDVASLFVQDRSRPAAAWHVMGLSGYSEAAALAYRRHFASIDVRLGPLTRLSPGGVYIDDHTLAFAAIERSEIHNDFYRPLGVGHGMGVNLFADGSRQGMLSVHRALSKGGFRDHEVRRMERLAPHLRRALQLHRQVARADALAVSAARCLDHFEMPVLLLDRTGRVALMNAAADAMLAKPGCGPVLRGRHLAAVEPSAVVSLRRVLEAATDPAFAALPEIVPVPGRTGALCVMAVPARQPERLGATGIHGDRWRSCSFRLLQATASTKGWLIPLALPNNSI